ncbi:hypothetical protein [Hyphomicrobium sp. CS1GBMeth3]|uniref:hypothetical protein n=1 Tax=Hyphomicrobium sp. CS1GBMeth3 TaxID=1892845 RepID=UPI000A74546A|nr:hypothetical protein [Hyphomicrobium sp. CS1GBMeth3]
MMKNSSASRARAAERSLWRIFFAPALIALASSVGLISGLVGDGLMDAIAWIGLGAPVAASAFYVFARSSD